MAVNIQFDWVTITGDTVVHLPGDGGYRIAPDSGSTPRVIGINSNLQDGDRFCIHNLSGMSVTLVHRSASAGAEVHKLVLTDLGANFVLRDGQMVWGIRVDPNDTTLADADRGNYVSDGGEPPFARSTATGSTSDPTSTSATPSLIPEMTLTVATAGAEVWVHFSGSFDVRTGDAGTVQLYVDGSAVASTLRTFKYTSSQGALDPDPVVVADVGFSALVEGLAAGSHTFQVKWTKTTGTLRALGVQRSLQLIEVSS